ncbi:hypothetical protein RQP46_005549 [Phenoliferia psychrophenolica]
MDEHRDATEDSRLSTSPDREAAPADETTATGATAGPKLKRNRESEYGPSTPKGDSEESKVLGGLTPLAKKGRVQPDSLVKNGVAHDPASDSDSLLGDDDEGAAHPNPNAVASSSSSSRRDQTTPPPPGIAASAPATPLVENDRPPSLKTESKDTRSIRQRVEALEWDDSQGPPPPPVATSGEDTEIADASAPEEGEGELVPDRDEGDEAKDSQEERAMDVAEVASEVAESAQQLAKEDESKEAADVEIAEVAASVGQTAARLDKEDDDDQTPQKIAQDSQETAIVAAEVSESAKVVDPVPSPQPPAVPQPPAPSKAVTSFATPFSSFASAASPFAASVKPPPPPPTQEQKPKAKTVFGAPPSLPSSTPAVTRAVPASTTPLAFGTPSASIAPKVPTPTPAPTPPTTFSKPTTPASAPAPSPFSSFASSSGFGAAASSSAAFGSYSAKTASPFATLQRSASVETEDSSSRKLGEPVKPDAAKPVFTKQEEQITGEEDDDTLHSVKCKLFAMSAEGQWVERGMGPLKLNASHDPSRNVARLVMRADATHRLLLNATLFSAFQIEIFQDKYVRFAMIEANGPVSYMLRMSGAPAAQALVQVVSGRVKQL